MTTALTPTTTVGQIVADHPALARVFERLGIDYCCGGKKTLREAAAARGLDPNTLVATLTAAASDGDAPASDPASMSLTALADHIEQTHHAYLRRELPRLETLAQKVAAVHGQGHAELLELRQVLAAFIAEIASHMAKEEQILFPIIRRIEAAEGPVVNHCGTIANPIRVMEMEHASAGDALGQMRQLTTGFTPPADACNSWRVLLDGLRQLEADMHQHVHKENNILFPRALEAESALAAAR